MRLLIALLFAALLPTSATAVEERLFAFQSINDPDVIPDPAVCARSGFPEGDGFVISEFGASLWTFQSRPNGRIRNRPTRQIGTATACVSLNLAQLDFEPGDQIPIFGEFIINGRTLELDGLCTVASDDIPVPDLFLTACSMASTATPSGVIGASASSNSVFNVNQIPGFDTGSFWVLRVFTQD